MVKRTPSANIIQVIAPPDRALLSLAKKLFEQGQLKQVQFRFAPGAGETVDTLEELENYESSFPRHATRRFQNAKFTTNGKTDLHFDRGTTVMGLNNNWQVSPSATHAEFCFESLNRDAEENAPTLVDAVHSVMGDNFQPEWNVSGEMSEAMAGHVANLGDHAIKIADLLTKTQLEQNDALKALRDDQLAEHNIKLSSLEEEYAQKKAELSRKEEEFEKRKKELDDRQARHARRELRKVITDNIKTRLSEIPASVSTRQHRAFVSVVILIGLALAGISAFYAGYRLSAIGGQNSILLYITAAQLFGSTALAATLVFYWLSYRKRIADEDNRFERRLELYALDIDRSSWTIETIIEFNDESNSGAVPEAWLKGVTANLFTVDNDGHNDDLDALDGLGALLRTGVKMEAGTNGIKVTTDPGSSKRIAKSSE